MFDSQTSRGPKLVYTHSRLGSSSAEDDARSTLTPSPLSTQTSGNRQAHAIPRPSVTVVAQTRKSSKDDNSGTNQRSSTPGVTPTFPADPSIMNAISRFSANGGQSMKENQKQHGRRESYDNYVRTIPIQIVGSNEGERFESFGASSSSSPATPRQKKTSNSQPGRDPNNNGDIYSFNAGSSGKFVSGTGFPNSSDSDSSSSNNNNKGGFHEGYRVYRGKVYEMNRDMPMTLGTLSGVGSDSSSTASRDSSAPTTPRGKVSSFDATNGKGAHFSTAMSPISETVANQHQHKQHQHINNHQLQQPRALPGPKLNGKPSNGISWTHSQVSSESADDSDYDQPLPFNQQTLFKEHRRQLEEARANYLGSEYTNSYSGGDGRRTGTIAGGRRRESSPPNKPNRGRSGSVTSNSSRRHHSPQRSASVSRAYSFGKGVGGGAGGSPAAGGHVWTVVTLRDGDVASNSSPRQRASTASTGTRASYRLDPSFATKLQVSSSSSPQTPGPFPVSPSTVATTSSTSSTQPKSILKSSPAPSIAGSAGSTNTTFSTSGRSEQSHDLYHAPNSDFQPFNTSGDRATYTLPRPRATLVYRDFDFSGLPKHQNIQHCALKHSKAGQGKLVQFPIRIPIVHDKGHLGTMHRRPATAGAAVQKVGGGVLADLSSQPQKKSVTFNTEVRLHVDSNVSTIRSLSIDSN